MRYLEGKLSNQISLKVHNTPMQKCAGLLLDDRSSARE